MKYSVLLFLIFSLNAVGITFDVAPDERAQFNQGRKLAVSTSNGQMIGYKVIRIKPQSMFQRAGFQEQDLITYINGLDVTDQNNIKEINRIWFQSDDLEFRIDRDPGEMPIFIRVKFNVKDTQVDGIK